MPRLKPPPSQVAPEIEDNTPPDAPIEIELANDEFAPVEVELAPQPEPPAAPREPEPAPENPLAAQIAAQARAEELQRQVAAQQQQIAERETQLAQERLRGDDAEYNSVLTAIAAEQGVLDKAESDFAAYSSAGDFQTAAKLQVAMARTAARLDRLEDGKLAFEQRRTARPEPAAPAPAAPAAPAALSFEQRIDKMPDTAKSWLRQHPEFINDSAKNEKIGAAHTYLTKNKGVEPFTPAYFDALDEEFGFKTPPAAPQPQPARRSMPVSAPVSRDVPTATGVREPSTKMTLNEEERRIARTSFTAPDMTNAQKEYLYAQNKRKLQQRRASGEYPMPERN